MNTANNFQHTTRWIRPDQSRFVFATPAPAQAMNIIKRFFVEDDASTAVEYGVMLALILLTMIVSVAAFGSSTGSWWGGISTSINSYF